MPRSREPWEHSQSGKVNTLEEEKAKSKLSGDTKSYSTPSKYMYPGQWSHSTGILALPQSPKIVACPGGPSFFGPSFNKLLLPLFPLPSTDRKAAALGFSDVHHSALNVIHKLKQWKLHKTTKKAKHSQNRFERIRKTAIINNVGTRGVSLRNHGTLSKFPDVQGGQAIMFNSWRI